jgi:hypothetical protein
MVKLIAKKANELGHLLSEAIGKLLEATRRKWRIRFSNVDTYAPSPKLFEHLQSFGTLSGLRL